jgi:hypothetical protein
MRGNRCGEKGIPTNRDSLCISKRYFFFADFFFFAPDFFEGIIFHLPSFLRCSKKVYGFDEELLVNRPAKFPRRSACGAKAALQP